MNSVQLEASVLEGVPKKNHFALDLAYSLLQEVPTNVLETVLITNQAQVMMIWKFQKVTLTIP